MGEVRNRGWLFHLLKLLTVVPTSQVGVMVNIMCQPGWAIGCLFSVLNIILGISGRVSLDEIDIQGGGLEESRCPSMCGWASPNQWKA